VVFIFIFLPVCIGVDGGRAQEMGGGGDKKHSWGVTKFQGCASRRCLSTGLASTSDVKLANLTATLGRQSP
jgi:hypothetical protein